MKAHETHEIPQHPHSHTAKHDNATEGTGGATAEHHEPHLHHQHTDDKGHAHPAEHTGHKH